jgi:N-acetylmuramoyl-L-alanine amidase
VFLSIHVNAANPRWKQPGTARGFETYFLSEARTEDARRVEAMENEVVKYEVASGVAANDPLSFIVHDMEQNQHLRESSELAATVQRGLAKKHPGPNRGVKQAGFRVLVTAFMPAVLVEIGFGTNPAEARYLRDPRRQREIASSIADATMEYLAAYQRRTNAAGSESK